MSFHIRDDRLNLQLEKRRLGQSLPPIVLMMLLIMMSISISATYRHNNAVGNAVISTARHSTERYARLC